MTVTAITLIITMTALNTAAIEYTMGHTFAVGLAGDNIVYDNDEVMPAAVLMAVVRPVEQQQHTIKQCKHVPASSLIVVQSGIFEHCIDMYELSVVVVREDSNVI